ncbi:MAG: hypothetical protein AAF591_23405 [Verrucomicrobiota bacterium]
MKNEEIAGQEPAKNRVVDIAATVTPEFSEDLKKSSAEAKLPPELMAGAILTRELCRYGKDRPGQRQDARATAAKITGEKKLAFELPTNLYQDLEDIVIGTGMTAENWLRLLIVKEAKKRRCESFRAIINGCLYDTATSLRIDEATSRHRCVSKKWSETLYRTKNEAFFLHCQGEENAERHANRESIQLMNEEGVKAWLEYHNLTFSYEELFTVEKA